MSKTEGISITKIDEKEGDKVIIEQFQNGFIDITLNRPEKMNSTDLHLFGIIQTLFKLADPPAYIISAKGDRAFCAGEDVITLQVQKKRQNNKYLEQYLKAKFEVEQELEKISMVLNKPVVVIFNGMCIGGGYSFAQHSNFRIVTENTLINFPECQMGTAIPCIKFLASLEKQHIVNYMIATGSSLKGQELVYAGLADFVIPSTKIRQLKDSLSFIKNELNMREVILRFASKLKQTSSMFPLDKLIKKYFSNSNIVEIIEQLENALNEENEEDKVFAKKTLDKIQKSSPLSLSVNFKLIQKAHSLSDSQCYQINYSVMYKLLSDHDFEEAVKTKIIQKKKSNPVKWVHKNIMEVSQLQADSIFSSSGVPSLPLISH